MLRFLFNQRKDMALAWLHIEQQKASSGTWAAVTNIDDLQHLVDELEALGVSPFRKWPSMGWA